MTTTTQKPLQGSLSIPEALDRYGNMPLGDFLDLAIAHGLIPCNLQLMPVDELAIRPQPSTPVRMVMAS